MLSKNMILLTHGDLATGIIQSAQLILGKIPNLFSISIGLDETVEDIINEIKKIEASFFEEKPIIIVTDIPGGSTTQAAIKVIEGQKDKYLITGLNLGLLLTLVTLPLTKDRTDNLIKLKNAVLEAKNTIQIVDNLFFDLEQNQDGEL